jgi:phosphohistidine phosphatase
MLEKQVNLERLTINQISYLMRKLLLIRHAKSSWKFPDLDDHERPLNKRGERDVLTMARQLEERDEALEVIYSSTATRALDYAQTLSAFTHTSLIPDLSFYTFDDEQLLEILRHLPDEVERAAVVAHNPAVTLAVNHLTASDFDNVPTAAIVAIKCDVDHWADLNSGQCEIDYFDYPKKFK